MASARDCVICLYCHTPSNKVHSHYKKSFQDLPIQDKKVMIVLNNRKLFCVNEHCNKRTFAETFELISSKSKKTIRLEREIIRISQHVSSLSAAKIINARVATIGKSTICNLF
ncbi:transposase family protein [Paenibacillus yanchengensis]|uniref:Transposase family protein n=1 Tax=Paenibacillus yanchengensis TaxID=2035833 RepID=A0ABW4YQK9_9BACL